ncbi:flagellar hook-associated protein FlgL [Bacillus luteolus]|uniref:Flagellar hook-associated protein FlgL n=1 Tax=Litchfieldia luteola TaxID=682179 RepID=A0ABR9QEY6_9BACI|nr:flagellar hook-associated protein FlgL [Cytobacillus luteolus]MBE4907054.1 flagellar hook-associated protein FlgL [Cytobacillus luteolus]MBP1943479.1 flagellar hook-associated protein 3 FlgL [Cytobacillus luteolus]
MRITQNMLANNSLRHLSKSYERMGVYQDQLATGKKINRPSDDPVVAMKGMHYRTNLTEIEQYKRNLSEVYAWMENSDSSLDHANSVLHRVNELTLQGKNGTNSPEDRQAIAREIEQLMQDVKTVANTQVAGKYIFNGININEAPVSGDNTLIVTQNTQPFEVEVSKGVKLKANINPSNVFSQDLFNTLQQIKEGLETNDISNMDDLLNQLSGHQESLSAERSELGARYNRLELVESRIDVQTIIASRILSDNEDADIEKVITDLKIQESVHRAALGVGARIIQPSLLDFLR